MSYVLITPDKLFFSTNPMGDPRVAYGIASDPRDRVAVAVKGDIAVLTMRAVRDDPSAVYSISYTLAKNQEGGTLDAGSPDEEVIYIGYNNFGYHVMGESSYWTGVLYTAIAPYVQAKRKDDPVSETLLLNTLAGAEGRFSFNGFWITKDDFVKEAINVILLDKTLTEEERITAELNRVFYNNLFNKMTVYPNLGEKTIEDHMEHFQ